MVLYSPPVISLSHALPSQPDPNRPASMSLNLETTGLVYLSRNHSNISGLIPIPTSASGSNSFMATSLPGESLARPMGLVNTLDFSPSSHAADSLLASQLLGGNGNPGVSAQQQGVEILLAALLLLNLGSLGRRMRSGSLFLTNSIWNDDSMLMHLPLHASCLGVLDMFQEGQDHNSNPGSLFLSPTLGPQLGIANPTRNRSHTTTGAVHGGLGSMHGLEGSRLGLLPFMASAKNDASLLLDNLVLNLSDTPGLATRNRSQTYLGVTPSIPEIPMVRNPMMMMQGQKPFPPMNSVHNHGVAHSQPQGHPTLAPNMAHGPIAGEGMFPMGASFNQPILQNDFDFADVSITTDFENPSLGPTSTIVLDNVPHFVDAANLFQLLNNSTGGMHGRGVLSVRVSSMPSSKMALVECSSIEVAMGLKANFNHLEIVPGIILYVAFARVSDQPKPQSTSDPLLNGQNLTQKRPLPPGIVSSNGTTSGNGSNSSGLSMETQEAATPKDLESSLIFTVSRLSTIRSIDVNKIKSLILSISKFPKSKYQTNFGPLPEPIPIRQFDSPKLRELRKILENNERLLQNGTRQNSPGNETDGKIMSQLELEDLSLAMLDELPELCHDHIGNTIVQKIFSVIESPLIKLMMVKEIAPYLTQLSIHKNGTWAIQKIINLCQNDVQQKQIIANSLKPYTVKLFNDQFGNYVLQCCLKFGSPFNDFIFEAMLDNFTEISSGRFGARCIRTILETANDPKSTAENAVSNEQVFLVASLIVEHANELAVNSNGSLLITWFLDTFSGCRGLETNNKYEVLAGKFLPHLDKLCTHKLAHLTIFKILNNRADYRVKQLLMDAIFGPYNEFEEDDIGMRPPSTLLETILQENPEHNAGPLFIYKILSNPILLTLGDEFKSACYQQFVVNHVKRALLEMNILNLQPYKKLVDEVGLSSNRLNRSSSTRKNKRGNSRGSGKSHSPRHQPIQSHVPPGQVLPPPMGYMNQVNNGNYPIYQPMANLYATGGNMAPMGGPAMMNPPNKMVYGSQQPSQHEMTVMQQLEQLSLSSAALGYTSNPVTPNGAGNQSGQFF